MKSFRLIDSGYSDAASNMAVDEALFLACRENPSEPVLRFYAWKPEAVSLGISQDCLNLLKDPERTPFVRRPTGGGLIYHANEVTYCLVCNTADIGLEGKGVKISYEILTSFLVSAYKNLGLDACFACFAKDACPTEKISNIAPVCFGRNEEYDIIVDNLKLGGSAQKRSKNTILQHGSIPFSFDAKKLKAILKEPGIGNIRAAGLKDLLGRNIKETELKDALCRAFSGCFQMEARKSTLNAREKELTELLKEKKYSNLDWNFNKDNYAREKTSLAQEKDLLRPGN